jgi:FixJ family two-component response regulator
MSKKGHDPACVVLVDGNPHTRDAVTLILRGQGLKVVPYASAEECLARKHLTDCLLLILQLGSPGVEGLGLLAWSQSVAPWVPVVVLCRHGDVEGATIAMKAGAMDVLEEPVDRAYLLRVLGEAMMRSTLAPAPLTRPETWVLHLLAGGMTNREIAAILSRSRRTIEVHRSSIMRKLGASNSGELVKSAERLGLFTRQQPAKLVAS